MDDVNYDPMVWGSNPTRIPDLGTSATWDASQGNERVYYIINQDLMVWGSNPTRIHGMRRKETHVSTIS